MGSKTTTSSTKARYTLRPWKVALMVVCAVMIAVGAVLALTGSEPQASTSSGGPATSGIAPSSLVDGASGSAPTTLEAAGGSQGIWSPALLRGGISFFIAFCLAFAFRSFLRFALIFIGIWGASLFYLDHLGWIEVHWGAIDDWFKGWTSGLGEQFKSVQTFVTGSLPSAGLAGLGLFTGFRRG